MAATKGLGTTGNGAGVVTPLDHKLAQSGLIAKVGAGSNLIRPGLFYDGVTNIVLGKPGMSYDVVAFTAATTRGGAAGSVLLTNDGVVNLPISSAPGSNSRIDVVYVWPREFLLDGVNSNPVIGVLEGSPGVSPVAPSLAAFPGAIELARITVAAGATATNGVGVTITQTAPFTTVDGGVLVRRTTAERDAISSPMAGLLCRVLADGITYQHVGSAWVPAYSGGINIRVTRASNTPGLSTGYVDLSANANWLTTTPAAQNRGFAAYSNGITIPVTGVYRVGYSLASAASIPFLAGVTVNDSSPDFTDFRAIASAAVAQGVASVSASAELRLAASDVLRLYAIANSGTPALSASLGSFYAEWLRAD